MKYKGAWSKLEREKIFELFINSYRLKFNQIEKALNIRSNKLVYYLKQMEEDELIAKEDEYYVLTKKAEKFLPYFAHFTGKEVGPLVSVLTAIMNEKSQILLLKRKNRPYKGYWSMVGGKPIIGEGIDETAIRKVKEETNLDCEFKTINGVVHERVFEKDDFKHTFILFLVTVSADSKSQLTKREELQWFNLKGIPEKETIPSDYWMIKKLLKKKAKIYESIIEESAGEIKSFTAK